MTVIVLLDPGPLGMATNPRASAETNECNEWLLSLLLKGYEVRVPEIADYEVWREVLRADKLQGIARLDDLKWVIGYVLITTSKAAQFWVEARKRGRQWIHNHRCNNKRRSPLTFRRRSTLERHPLARSPHGAGEAISQRQASAMGEGRGSPRPSRRKQGIRS